MSNDWHYKSHEERVESLLDEQARALRDVADHLGKIANALESLVESQPARKE